MPPKGLQPGAPLRGVVLDVTPTAGVVDLSCRPALVKAAESAGEDTRKMVPAGTLVCVGVDCVDHCGFDCI